MAMTAGAYALQVSVQKFPVPRADNNCLLLVMDQAKVSLQSVKGS